MDVSDLSLAGRDSSIPDRMWSRDGVLSANSSSLKEDQNLQRRSIDSWRRCHRLALSGSRLRTHSAHTLARGGSVSFHGVDER